MFHPYFTPKMDEYRRKAFLEEADQGRLRRELPLHNHPPRILWISLAASAPIVLLILWLTIFA
jgi:hypothetical protein